MAEQLLGYEWDHIHKTPQLGLALDQFATDNYGPDHLVAGHLALDDDGTVIDVRVYVNGPIPGPLETPFGDNKEAWEDFVAWMEGLDASRTLTFFRRPHSAVHMGVEPFPPDLHLFDATLALAPRDDILYHGHIITNGTQTSILLPPPDTDTDDGLGMAALMSVIDQPTQARIGRQLLENAKESSLDPDTVAAIEELLDGLEANKPITPADRSKAEFAMQGLQAKLAELEAELTGQSKPKPKNPTDVPDVKARPDVPKAFLN